MGNEKINSLQVESLLTFEKLKAVTMYELNGSVIKWNEVENAQGYKVVFAPGSRFNIKITTPEDIKLGEIILNYQSF